MISIDNLTVRYGEKTVLDNLSATFPRGRVNGLMGVNGAGKTTLLDAVSGLYKVDRQKILAGGEPLSRSRIAYLESENYFYRGMTGREYLRLFAGRRDDPAIAELNRLFDLPLDRTVESYSAGMKKKLALGGVILRRKEIVLMDEPFNGLDTESVFLLKELIRRMRDQGRTVIVTSHIPETLTPVCDNIQVLSGGKIRAVFAPSDYPRLTQFLEAGFNEKYGDLKGLDI